MRVLLVEDTYEIGEGMAASLANAGHVVDWAHDGEDGLHYLSQGEYDLAVLDLMLPGASGETLLRSIRNSRATTPVLITTARSNIDDRITLLDLGADDYLTKPFDFREFEARVRSMLRRGSGNRCNVLECNGVTLDRAAKRATVNGRPMILTGRELSLLEILMANRDKILSKAQLLDQLIGYDAEPNENAIEVLVGRLRRKLGEGSGITTHRGLGYSIETR